MLSPKILVLRWTKHFWLKFLMIDSNAFTTDFISLVFCVKSNKHIKNSLTDAFFTTLHFYPTPNWPDWLLITVETLTRSSSHQIWGFSWIFHKKGCWDFVKKKMTKWIVFFCYYFQTFWNLKKMRQNMQNLLWGLVWIVMLTFIWLLLTCSLFLIILVTGICLLNHQGLF